jgi:hypothetical protein
MAYSDRNSTLVPLEAAQTWTGDKDAIADWSSVVTMAKADKACQVRHEYSADGSNWDSMTTFTLVAGTEQTCRTNAIGRYFRAVAINTSGENMSELRISTSYKTASDPAAATSVEVTALPPVEIAADQSVSLAAGTSVDIGSLPAVSIAAAQEIGLAAGSEVALAAGSEVALAAGATVALAAGSEVALAAGTEVTVANDIIVSTLPAVDLAAGSEILTEYKTGLATHRSLAFTATGQSIKGSAGRLYGCALQNLSPSNDCYVKFYDQAGAPANTDTPFASYYLKAEATLALQFPQGLACSSGLGIRATEALADSDNTNPAGTVIGTVHYL